MVYKSRSPSRTKTTQKKRPSMGTGMAERAARSVEKAKKPRGRMGRAAGIARKIPRR